MQPRTGEMIFLLAALAAIAGLCFAVAPPGLYSNEEGVRYVQMRNFAENGTLEIAWPGYRLGFGAEDLAGQGGHFESRDGRLFAITPPLFPSVASLFYPVVGERAVDVAPILFVFLSVLLLGATLDRVMPRGVLYYLLLAALLAGSPALLLAYKFSGVELFVRPGGEGGYVALEVNAGGAFSLRFIEDWTRTTDRFAKWTAVPALAAARVRVAHTLPAVVDPEKAGPLTWLVKVALPLDLLESYCGPIVSEAKRAWRANLFKCGDQTSHPHWASWAPIGEALNFHQPQYFGTLRFDLP